MAVPTQPRSAGVTVDQCGRAVPGVALGRQPAVRLLVLRRSCQSGRGECPAGACARPAARTIRRLGRFGASCLAWDHAPDGARRAPRAFKDVWKVLTDRHGSAPPVGTSRRHRLRGITQGTDGASSRNERRHRRMHGSRGASGTSGTSESVQRELRNGRTTMAERPGKLNSRTYVCCPARRLHKPLGRVLAQRS
jgi:hypothetical protein